MKKIISIVIACLLLVLPITSAFAETKMSASITGGCYRVYTPSGYLARSSSANGWSSMRVNCTKITVDNGGYHDFYLKSYDAAGGAAAEDTLCEEGYTYIGIYSSHTSATKITFKVYNSNYYEESYDGYHVHVTATVQGYLQA